MARASALAPLRYFMNHTWTSVGNLVLMRTCPTLCRIVGQIACCMRCLPWVPSPVLRANATLLLVRYNKWAGRPWHVVGLGHYAASGVGIFLEGRGFGDSAHVCALLRLFSALAGTGANGRAPGACPARSIHRSDLICRPNSFFCLWIRLLRLSFYLASHCVARVFLLCVTLWCRRNYSRCVIF